MEKPRRSQIQHNWCWIPTQSQHAAQAEPAAGRLQSAQSHMAWEQRRAVCPQVLLLTALPDRLHSQLRAQPVNAISLHCSVCPARWARHSRFTHRKICCWKEVGAAKRTTRHRLKSSSSYYYILRTPQTSSNRQTSSASQNIAGCCRWAWLGAAWAPEAGKAKELGTVLPGFLIRNTCPFPQPWKEVLTNMNKSTRTGTENRHAPKPAVSSVQTDVEGQQHSTQVMAQWQITVCLSYW